MTQDPTQPIVRVRNLVKRWRQPGGALTTVLDVPAFELGPGEELALEGSSGCGKTTFLHLLAGILTPSEGEVELAGVALSQQGEAQRDQLRAQHIGYVFQSFHLLQGFTALENVELGMAFGAGVDRARASELLERVGLGGRLAHRPGQLSVGQQQRVAVARALANSPALVLADEPTGNLDRALAGEALALLREVCSEAGAALLLVSHDPHVLEGFERVQRFEELNRALGASTLSG